LARLKLFNLVNNVPWGLSRAEAGVTGRRLDKEPEWEQKKSRGDEERKARKK